MTLRIHAHPLPEHFLLTTTLPFDGKEPGIDLRLEVLVSEAQSKAPHPVGRNMLAEVTKCEPTASIQNSPSRVRRINIDHDRWHSQGILAKLCLSMRDLLAGWYSCEVSHAPVRNCSPLASFFSRAMRPISWALGFPKNLEFEVLSKTS
jgi:hypothetical protein